MNWFRREVLVDLREKIADLVTILDAHLAQTPTAQQKGLSADYDDIQRRLEKIERFLQFPTLR